MEPVWQPTMVRLTRTSNKKDSPAPRLHFFARGGAANREAVQHPSPGVALRTPGPFAPKRPNLIGPMGLSDPFISDFISEQHHCYDACCKRRLRANRPPAAKHASPMANTEVGSGTELIVTCVLSPES